MYALDPDGPGILPPIMAKCIINGGDPNTITQVPFALFHKTSLAAPCIGLALPIHALPIFHGVLNSNFSSEFDNKFL